MGTLPFFFFFMLFVLDFRFISFGLSTSLLPLMPKESECSVAWFVFCPDSFFIEPNSGGGGGAGIPLPPFGGGPGGGGPGGGGPGGGGPGGGGGGPPPPPPIAQFFSLTKNLLCVFTRPASFIADISGGGGGTLGGFGTAFIVKVDIALISLDCWL